MNRFARLHSDIWPKLPENSYGFSGPEFWISDRQAVIIEAYTVIKIIANHYGPRPDRLQEALSDAMIAKYDDSMAATMTIKSRECWRHCHRNR